MLALPLNIILLWMLREEKLVSSVYELICAL